MEGGNVSFNLQQFLHDMREEQTTALATLTGKVDEGFTKAATVAAEHELSDARQFGTIDSRLHDVESAQRTVRWASRTVIGGFVLWALNTVLAHWK